MSADPLAATLLQRAHSPDTASTLYRDKIKLRPLLLRPSSPDPTQNARSARQHTRLVKQRALHRSNKPRPLSAKQKRSLCIYDIPKSQQKYSIYEPIHVMWCAYMRDILGLADGKRSHIEAQDAGPFLASADYHGAIVEVVRSRCASRVGMKGVVVRDTKFTFEIVTRRDEVKVLPKEHSVFRVEVPFENKEGDEKRKPLVFEVLGEQFQQRATDRANRKFRWHADPDL
nr:hypothetical protein B0A51_07043 [Rachicladosporium sp. CCFEE 5018]